MNKIIVLGLLVLSITARAEFVEVKGKKKETLISQTAKKLVKYFDELGDSKFLLRDCFMSGTQSLTTIYEKDGGMRSRTFFFRDSGSSSAITDAYKNSEDSTLAFVQSFGFRGFRASAIYVYFNRKKVSKVDFIVDYGKDYAHKITCTGQGI